MKDVKHHRPQLCLTISLLLCLAVRAEQSASMPAMKVAPKVDGIVDSKEWRGAAGFCGLQRGGSLEARHAWVLVGYDSKNIYLAFRSELPPDRKLVTKVKRRGGHVVGDDSLEVWIVPPKAGRPDGPRGQGYFQLIVNSAGTIFDRHYEPGYGQAPQAWNVHMQSANRMTDDGFWEAEIAIPLSDFGIEKLLLPSEWRFLAVRNFKNPWVQANLTGSSVFSNVKAMMPLRFAGNAPAVQVQSMGNLLAGKPDLAIGIQNPGNKKAELSLHLKVQKGKETVIEREEQIDLAPDSFREFKVAGEFVPEEKNLFSLSVTDRAGERTFYQREFSFAPAPKHKWTTPESFLSFVATFDAQTLQADLAKGKGKPLKVEGEVSYVDGIKGKALLLPKGASVSYDSQENLPVPGAVTFWVQPRRDRIRDTKRNLNTFTSFFWTRYKQTGYLGIQDSVNYQLNLWLHYFPGTKNWNVSTPFHWEKDRWYHMCANLHGKRVELFLDGDRVASAVLERALKQEELSPFVLGPHGPYAYDDLRIFSRALSVSEVRQLAMGEEKLDGRIAYFPSLKSLVIEAVADPEEQGDLATSLVVKDGNEKKELLRKSIAAEDWEHTPAGTRRIRRIIKLPELKEGLYKTWLEAAQGQKGVTGRSLVRSFRVKRFPWENNTLGKSDLIISPFTPLEVSGTTVKSVLREHGLGPLGLWRQVKSLDRKILARPIALHAEAGGKRIDWQHEEARFNETKPHLVTFQASSTCAWMDIHSTGVFDYDGLMKVTLNIKPRKAEAIDSMWLEIPVRASIASLFHASGEHIRANPAGDIPKGEGVVWNSRSIPQSNIDNFIPYIWVGGPQRGICWVADWDKDWVHSETRSAVQLVREKDAVVIRLNLINGPVKLTRPREIQFALQASPVKPMPKNYQSRVYDFVHPGTGRYALLWSASWGGHYGWSSRYPLNEDYTLIRKITETTRNGKIDQAYIREWVKTVMEHTGKLIHRPSEETVRRHVQFSFNRAKPQFQREPPGKMMWYSCARDSAKGLPEFEVYGDEWEYRARMDCSPSFVDYAVYYANKMMEAGMQGIYIDNTFSASKFSWPVGDAYIDEETREIRPNLGILSRTRNLVRRLAHMMAEKGREPFVWVHMTNANLIPMLSFAQANLGWEWKYSSQDYQDKFTAGYMRAMNTGRQTGNLSILLGGTTGIKDEAENIRVTRTGLAMALPHQTFFYARVHSRTAIKVRDIIREFLQDREAEEWPYWSDDPVVKAPNQLPVTTYRTGDRLLLIIGNMGEADDFSLELDLARLKAAGIVRATNLETKEPAASEEGSIGISMKRRDLALLEVVLKR